MGELDRAGLTERDRVLERDGERPLRAEKNPCFFSICIKLRLLPRNVTQQKGFAERVTLRAVEEKDLIFFLIFF